MSFLCKYQNRQCNGLSERDHYIGRLTLMNHINWRLSPLPSFFWKLTHAKHWFTGKMEFSPDFQFTVSKIKQDRDWSVIKINTESEPLYTTYREPGTLHCSPPTSRYDLLSLSFPIPLSPSAFFIYNLCGPSCPQSRKSLSVGEATGGDGSAWENTVSPCRPDQGFTRISSLQLAHLLSLCKGRERIQRQPGNFYLQGPFYLQICLIILSSLCLVSFHPGYYFYVEALIECSVLIIEVSLNMLLHVSFTLA